MKRRNLLKNLALGVATVATGAVAYLHRGAPHTQEVGGISSGSNVPFYTRTRKFLVGNRVRIDETLPFSMAHFDAGFEAIISSATRSQGKWQYGVVLLEDGVPFTRCAWYPESVLTLIDDDCNLGCGLLAWYDESH